MPTFGNCKQKVLIHLPSDKHTAQQIMLESSTANSSCKPEETQQPISHYTVWRDSLTRREEIDFSHEWYTSKINPGPESQTMVQSLQHLLIEHTSAIQGSRINKQY